MRCDHSLQGKIFATALLDSALPGFHMTCPAFLLAQEKLIYPLPSTIIMLIPTLSLSTYIYVEFSPAHRTSSSLVYSNFSSVSSTSLVLAFIQYIYYNAFHLSDCCPSQTLSLRAASRCVDPTFLSFGKLGYDQQHPQTCRRGTGNSLIVWR